MAITLTPREEAMPERDESTDLVERMSRDVDALFPEVVERYGPALYTTALRVSRQPADAEDLAAEAFVRAYRALSSYPPERIRRLRLRPWLVTILLNHWRNQLRRGSRRPDEVSLDRAGPVTAAPAASPEDAVVARQRIAVVLRHVVGLPYDEIGQVLGCPVGTAKSHVSRGLAALRSRFPNDQEEQS
jgi:DNA-directed RNA polymerase specialized sigma24 family protein